MKRRVLPLTRRKLLEGTSLVALTQCVPAVDSSDDDDGGAGGNPTSPPGRYADNVDALLDVLLPAERNGDGTVTSPGARELGAGALLDVNRFVPLAQTQGLLPALPDEVTQLAEGFDVALRVAINLDLDLLSTAEEPLTPFRDLSRSLQERVVRAAWDDEGRKPLYEVVRAAAFAAFLGAGDGDAGLVFVGHPPFEDYEGGIAVRGYPHSGDDYSYNRAPEPTAGTNLASVLNPEGDLY